MFFSALIAIVIGSGALASPTPTFPGPSDSFTALGQCNIAWTLDANATKPWTTMNIQLMTGSNAQMVHMRTVATVDATKQSSFSWICPEVNPNAPIYFYQFSSPTDPTNLLWVTRFLIKGTDGSSVDAPSTDPNGVKYGVGTFVDSSLYNAMPSYLVGNGQIQGGPGGGNGGGNGTTPTTTPGGTGIPSSTPTTSPISATSGGIHTITTSPGTDVSPTSTSTSTSTGGARPNTSSSLSLLAVLVITSGAIMLSN